MMPKIRLTVVKRGMFFGHKDARGRDILMTQEQINARSGNQPPEAADDSRYPTIEFALSRKEEQDEDAKTLKLIERYRNNNRMQQE